MKFSGVIGVVKQIQNEDGYWEEKPSEIHMVGDIKAVSETYKSFDSASRNTTRVGNSLSVLWSPKTPDDISNIRYVKWAGGCWAVESVEVHAPRLVLKLGGVYNGPTP